MRSEKNGIQFQALTPEENLFFKELRAEVSAYFKKGGISMLANRAMWFRAIFFLSAYAITWTTLTFLHPNPVFALFLCVFLGFLGTGIALNIGHESSHQTYSKKTWLNDSLYFISMNMLGTYSYLWKVGHLQTHHTLVNIPGHDVGTDANHALRFTSETPWKSKYRLQYLYAPLMYCTYTLMWVLMRDWRVYFSGEMSNHRFKKSPVRFVELLAIKLFYFGYMLVLPMVFSGFSASEVLTGFLTTHVVLSLYIATMLFTSHLNAKVQFPEPIQGEIPHSYIRHQLLTTLDIYPTSKVANFFLGGFNSHVIHHLFPNISAAHYPELSKILIELSKKHKMPYQQCGLTEAVGSHYRFLKKMGEDGGHYEVREAVSL